LKIRVAISSTRSRNSLGLFQRYVLRLENAFQGFMFPATAGVLSAVIFFGALIVLLRWRLSSLLFFRRTK